MLCFRRFPVAKNSMDKRRGYQDLPSKVFCLTKPKIFVGEPFSVLLLSGIKNVWIRVGGGGWVVGSIKIFRRNFFVSQCRYFWSGNPSVFQKFRVSKNVRDRRRGGYHDFP